MNEINMGDEIYFKMGDDEIYFNTGDEMTLEKNNRYEMVRTILGILLTIILPLVHILYY